MTAGKGLLAGLLSIGMLAAVAFDARAQDGLRSPALPDRTPTQPLPAVPPADLFRVSPDFYRQPPAFGPIPVWPGYGPIWPGYGWLGFPGQPTVVVLPQDALRGGRLSRQPGYLRLNVTPLTTDVYIDGEFSGRAVDFASRGRAIRAGLRRIEFRPPGGPMTSVELQVTAGETIAYSGRLESELTAPAPVRAAAAPRTYYVIAGCYAGDSEPNPARLPSGCRLDQVRSYRR